jgi:uncharacterized membrane protein YgaE (UPF0421/DUF939 family)
MILTFDGHMNKKVNIVIIYLIKCVIGIVCAYLLTNLLKLTNIASWCLLSTLLVLAPDTKDSYKLAITRIKANVIGAAVGLLILTVYTPGIVWVVIGVVVAITLCYVLSIEIAARSAAVAVIIILMHDEMHHMWEVAIDRALGVLLGCAIGMVITFIFHQAEKWWDKKHSSIEISDEEDKG